MVSTLRVLTLSALMLEPTDLMLVLSLYPRLPHGLLGNAIDKNIYIAVCQYSCLEESHATR